MIYNCLIRSTSDTFLRKYYKKTKYSINTMNREIREHTYLLQGIWENMGKYEYYQTLYGGKLHTTPSCRHVKFSDCNLVVLSHRANYCLRKNNNLCKECN